MPLIVTPADPVVPTCSRPSELVAAPCTPAHRRPRHAGAGVVLPLRVHLHPGSGVTTCTPKHRRRLRHAQRPHPLLPSRAVDPQGWESWQKVSSTCSTFPRRWGAIADPFCVEPFVLLAFELESPAGVLTPAAVRMTAVWAYLTGWLAGVSATWSSTRCNRAPARISGGVRRAPGARYTRPHLNPHHSALANEWESPCCGAAACVRLRCVATER